MKSTTEQIKDSLFSLATLDSSFLIGIADSRLLNTSFQENNLKESLENFQYYRESLIDLINRDPVLFERVVTYQTRTALITTLGKLSQLVQQFKKQPNAIPTGQQSLTQIIAQISVIQQLFSSLNLDSYTKHAPNYYKKLNEVSYLIRRYKDLEIELEDIEDLHERIKAIFEFSQVVDSKLMTIQKNADDVMNKTNAILKDIEARYEAIKNINKNTLEFEAITKMNSDSIIQFSNEIEKFKSAMADGIKQLKESLAQYEELNKEKISQYDHIISESISLNSDKTEKIISKNSQLQQTIIDILGKAIGTQLYRSFEKKATSLKWVSFVWLGSLVVSLIALTWIGYSVVDELIMSSAPFGVSFYLRITVLFPILYSVYFFATLYKTTNKIKEEYDFKSAVSVSLHHFKDIIENSKDNLETQTFLKDAVSQIFASPTELVFGHQKPDKDINDKVESIVDKIVTLASSIISKK